MLHLLSDMNTDHSHVKKEAVLVVWNEPQVTQWIGYFSAGLAVIAALSVAYEGQWPHLASVTAKRLLCRASLFCLWLILLHFAFNEQHKHGYWLFRPQKVRGCNTEENSSY